MTPSIADDGRLPRHQSAPKSGLGFLVSPKVTPFVFILPFLVFFIAFVVAPILFAAYLSLYRNRIVGGMHFVGLGNYVRALHDPELWSGISHIFAFGAWLIPILIGVALVSALIIDSGALFFGRVFRVGIFLPYAVPGVISTLLWGYIYGPNYGLITQIAHLFQMSTAPLLSAGNIIGAVANISIWQFLGYNFVIFYAALKGVPSELGEAAAVDGATYTYFIMRVKLPLIRDAIVTALLFSLIGTVQLFNEPFLLQPAARDVITASFTPSIYAYSLAFRYQEFNYAGAISFIIAGVAASLSGLFLWSTNRRRGV